MNSSPAYREERPADTLQPAIRFDTFATLIDYIEAAHERYLNKLRCVEEDIRFILNMCFQVIQGLVQLGTGRQYLGSIKNRQLSGQRMPGLSFFVPEKI